jgi:CheY-like chemotaxis protein
MLTLMAKKLNITAHCVPTCVEAMEELERSHVYAAVFIDLNLPHNPLALTCVEALRNVRKEKSLTFPIIAMTAYALESDRQLCFRAGVDDYLAKPFSGDEFSEVVRRWLDCTTEGHGRKAS